MICFFFFILPCLSYSQVIDKIIAKVDNEIVLKSELEVLYLQYLANNSTADPTELKCKVLESLLINKLLLAKAEIDSVGVEKTMVDDQLNRRMSYFVQQIGSEKKLEEYYGKSISALKEDLRKQVKDQLIIQKMQDQITGKVKVTPAEVRRYFNSIPKDSLPYFSTEVEVGQIVRVADISREQKLDTRKKLEKIKERIQAGEDFCELAKQYSEDPGSAKNCGELGFFKKGDLVPEYEAVALKLKAGEISGIVESDYGFHLIQMIERRSNEFNSRHILIKPNSSQKDLSVAEFFLDSIRTKILRDSLSFSKAAKDFSADKATVANGGFIFDEKTGTSSIPVEELDPSIFFIIDTMKVGNVSKPMRFKMEDGTEAIRIIYYKSKMPPHQANMVDDYQKIYKASLNEKKNKELSKWFDKTKGEVFIDIDKEYQNCNILLNQ